MFCSMPNKAVITMDRVAVVVPVYNESATIADILLRALQTQPALVIVVDDGSTDNTVDIVTKLPVVLLENPQNQGKSASLVRGMRHALEQNVGTVITLDGDGQHLPEDIPRFIESANTNTEAMVIGSRLHDKQAFPRKRYIANRVANFWISWAAGRVIDDSQSGFRLYPGSLLQHPQTQKLRGSSFVFESEILIVAGRLGYTISHIPIAAIYEAEARGSHFRPVWDIVKIIRMVAWILLSRGLYLQGFYRAFIRSTRSA